MHFSQYPLKHPYNAAVIIFSISDCRLVYHTEEVEDWLLGALCLAFVESMLIDGYFRDYPSTGRKEPFSCRASRLRKA